MLRTRCLISLALFLSFGAWRPPFCASAGKPTAASILNGTVRASTAESIAGVTVSAAAEGGTITTSVYTDEQGRYYFPSMPGGKAILVRMETINVYGKTGEPPSPIIQHYKEELAAYLTRVRGPGPSPMKIKPFPRPAGDAARVVVTEFNIPPAANPNELVDQDE